MIYRSNVVAPDLSARFKHTVCRPMAHSLGHDVMSDYADYPDDHPVFGLYKRAGFCTHDEAAILYQCAKASHRGWPWLEIGSLAGWSTVHIAAADRVVIAVDNMFPIPEFDARFKENTSVFSALISQRAQRSDQFFDMWANVAGWQIGGAFIDGDHDRPRPMEDAMNCARYATPDACILLHDAWGAPVREAWEWLGKEGWKLRFYNTPHGLGLAYRGRFVPPDHTPDPLIDWARIRRERGVPQ